MRLKYMDVSNHITWNLLEAFQALEEKMKSRQVHIFLIIFIRTLLRKITRRSSSMSFTYKHLLRIIHRVILLDLFTNATWNYERSRLISFIGPFFVKIQKSIMKIKTQLVRCYLRDLPQDESFSSRSCLEPLPVMHFVHHCWLQVITFKKPFRCSTSGRKSLPRDLFSAPSSIASL